MRGRAGLLAAVLGTALIPGLVAAQEDATPTPTETATPEPTQTIAPPQAVAAESSWDGQDFIVVTWAPSAGAESYYVEHAQSDPHPSAFTVLAKVEQSEKPSYRHNLHLVSGVYCYRIIANGGGTSSEPSAPACLITVIDRFLPPGGVEAHLEMVRGTPITVTWINGAGAVYPDSYIVERSRSGGQNQPRTYAEVARVVAGPNPSYRDTDTREVGLYCYRIRAVKGGGTVSDPSTEACVVRPVVDFFPPTPGVPDTGSGLAANDGGQPASSLLAGFGVLLVAGTAGLWAILRRR